MNSSNEVVFLEGQLRPVPRPKTLPSTQGSRSKMMCLVPCRSVPLPKVSQVRQTQTWRRCAGDCRGGSRRCTSFNRRPGPRRRGRPNVNGIPGVRGIRQAPLASDPLEIANQQEAQQHFRINRGAPRRAIEILQPVAHEAEIHIAIDQSQQVILRNLVLQTKVVEQRLRPWMLTHHRWRSS